MSELSMPRPQVSVVTRVRPEGEETAEAPAGTTPREERQPRAQMRELQLAIGEIMQRTESIKLRDHVLRWAMRVYVLAHEKPNMPLGKDQHD